MTNPENTAFPEPAGSDPSSGGYSGGSHSAPPPPPPGYYSVNPPLSQSDERTWGMLSHLLALLVLFVSSGSFGWVPPLVIFLLYRDRSPYVRAQAVESLNFQITFVIVNVVGGVAAVFGFIALVIPGVVIVLLLIAFGIAGLVWMILATLAANRGEFWKYPINFRLVK